MSQRVVQGLEIVQIDKQQCVGSVMASANSENLVKSIHQESAVRQFRQWIVKGQVLDLISSKFAIADICKNGYVVRYLSGVIFYRAYVEPLWEDLSALASIKYLTLPRTLFR